MNRLKNLLNIFLIILFCLSFCFSQSILEGQAIRVSLTSGDNPDLGKDSVLTRDSNGRRAYRVVASSEGSFLTTKTIVIVLGGSSLDTGEAFSIRIPYACTISKVTMLADQSGSVVVDIWKDVYANYPPDNADSITASAPPTITSDTDSEDTTLTGWTISILAGDVLKFNVDSVDTISQVTLLIDIVEA